MDPALRSARKERDRLAAELDRDPRFRLWQKWRDVVEEYERVEAASAPKDKKSSTASLVITAAVEFLRERNERATSSEIAEAVEQKNISIGAKDPVAAVSAYLSTEAGRKVIDNKKGQGYGLREWNDAPADEEAGEPSDGSQTEQAA